MVGKLPIPTPPKPDIDPQVLDELQNWKNSVAILIFITTIPMWGALTYASRKSKGSPAMWHVNGIATLSLFQMLALLVIGITGTANHYEKMTGGQFGHGFGWLLLIAAGGYLSVWVLCYGALQSVASWVKWLDWMVVVVPGFGTALCLYFTREYLPAIKPIFRVNNEIQDQMCWYYSTYIQMMGATSGFMLIALLVVFFKLRNDGLRPSMIAAYLFVWLQITCFFLGLFYLQLKAAQAGGLGAIDDLMRLLKGAVGLIVSNCFSTLTLCWICVEISKAHTLTHFKRYDLETRAGCITASLVKQPNMTASVLYGTDGTASLIEQPQDSPQPGYVLSHSGELV